MVDVTQFSSNYIPNVHSDPLLRGDMDATIQDFVNLTNNHEFNLIQIAEHIVKFKRSNILSNLMSRMHDASHESTVDSYLRARNHLPRIFTQRLVAVTSTAISFSDYRQEGTVKSSVVRLNVSGFKNNEKITKLTNESKTARIVQDMNNQRSHTRPGILNEDVNKISGMQHSLEHIRILPNDLLKQIVNTNIALNNTIYYGNKLNNNDIDQFIQFESKQ